MLLLLKQEAMRHARLDGAIFIGRQRLEQLSPATAARTRLSNMWQWAVALVGSAVGCHPAAPSRL